MVMMQYYILFSYTCRSNRLVRLFNKCSKPVLLELCRSFCTVFYCPYFWTHYEQTTFSKIRVAYNNVYWKILGVSRRASAGGMFMFVSNDKTQFEAFLRKSIYSFTTRLSSPDIFSCKVPKFKKLFYNVCLLLFA